MIGLLRYRKLVLTQGCDYFTDQKGALMIGQPDCLLDIIESFSQPSQLIIVTTKMVSRLLLSSV
jgi:hypothetical protein